LHARHAAGDLEALVADLLASWQDGRVKLYTTWRALAARAALPRLFTDGDYVPLLAEGDRARHVVAFARRHAADDASDGAGDRESWAIAVVPRWLSGMFGASQPPVGAAPWATTSLP